MSLLKQYEKIAPSSIAADMDTQEGKMAVLQDLEALYRLLVLGLDSTYLKDELVTKIGSQRAVVARHPELVHAITRRTVQNLRAGVRTGGIVAKTYILDVCNDDLVIQDIWLVSDTATTGSSGGSNYTFMPKRNGVNMLSSAKSTNGSEIAANTKYSMGVLLTAQTTASAGDVITLEVTKTGTPTDLSSAETVLGLESNSDFGS